MPSSTRDRSMTVYSGWELLIRGGVLWINTVEGSILRITGLPRDLDVQVDDLAGEVQESMNGT